MGVCTGLLEPSGPEIYTELSAGTHSSKSPQCVAGRSGLTGGVRISRRETPQAGARHCDIYELAILESLVPPTAGLA